MGTVHLVTCLLLILPSSIHSFLFPLKDGAKCKDNADCVSLSLPRGCCLMTGMEHGQPVGRCQPISRLVLFRSVSAFMSGEYCAPGDRLRRISGYSTYTFWCPCDVGLICRAAKYTQLPSRMGAYFDPQCVPEDFPDYATARPLTNDLDLGVTVV